MRRIVFIAGALTIGNFQVLCAESFSLGNLKISNIWARATPGRARTAAVYIERILNSGGQIDSLIYISSPLARKNLIHKAIVENGIAKMSHVKVLKIHAGRSVSLKPGGLHIMMIGIQKSLKRGSKFPMILEFKKAGKIKVVVEVKNFGSSSMMKMDHKKKHQH
jgi:hypothetical protein